MPSGVPMDHIQFMQSRFWSWYRRHKMPSVEEEQVQLGRPRRERAKQSAPAELMQVETKD